MSQTSVSTALWSIFTYYALHSDPNQPQHLKIPQFIRLCKDCQIISKQLTGTLIELEIVQLTRGKNPTQEYATASVSLTFAEFLHILEVLSVKVYPNIPSEVAMRRLLLENVLLLAGRRVPLVKKEELEDEEANALLNTGLSKALAGIFAYYVRRAEQRRNALSAKEVVHFYDTSVCDLWGYEEFVEFTNDYSLKSTSLLTALQLGDIFLQVVPLNVESQGLKGMSSTQFPRLIMLMALVAFRNIVDVSPLNKVKAFLLILWKSVNVSDKGAKAAAMSRSAVISNSAAGSANTFGSRIFTEHFLALWQKEKFPDYLTLKTTKPRMSNSVAPEGSIALQNIAHRIAGEDLNISDSLGLFSVHKQRRQIDNEFGELSLLNKEQLEAADTAAGSKKKSGGGKILINSYGVKELFKQRPEIAEYVHLEMVKEGLI